MARVVFNTFGSLGDVHPYLAIAIELRRRGHEPLIASSAVYREKVEAEGVGFRAVRPDVGELMNDAEFLAKLWDPRRGSEYLIGQYLVPNLEHSYEDLLPVCRGADLTLAHSVCYAGPIVAEVLRVPWISVALQPLVFLSADDRPTFSGVEWLRHFYGLGPEVFRLVMRAAGRQMKRWAEPVQQLRERVGLPRTERNPLLGYFSPRGTLALFSRHFGRPQRDWPANVCVTGFVFYDRRGELPGAPEEQSEVRDELARFLEAGAAPVLFTLGSSAVLVPGSFYKESIAAIKKLGVRAVLLTGLLPREELGALPESIYAASYLPYSAIMPKSAAIVHQGGIGTVAQALRAGRPMLLVPFAHDQPDNAERLRKLGVSRTVPRSRYTAARVARELKALLSDEQCAARAQELGAKIASEDGTASACDVIEEILRGENRESARN